MEDASLANQDVAEGQGPALILAGPGTGKTYTLARRVKYLVDAEGVDPDEITVITFTRAAARNMRETLSRSDASKSYVAWKQQPKLICTMHSLGQRIIAENAEKCGLSRDFRVVSAGQVALRQVSLRDVLMDDAAQLTGCERTYARETADCRQRGACDPGDQRKCHICEQYREILRLCDALDHDDQILLACELLEDQAILQEYQAKAKNLLVDEYQDINAAEYKFIRLLSAGQEDGLFVVGDDDQSIYSWRGSSPEFVRSFERHFGPQATVSRRSKCWRCPPSIFQGAEAMVARHNPERAEKFVTEFQSDSAQRIAIHSVASDQKEARIIASMVATRQDSGQSVIIVPGRRFIPDIARELQYRDIAYDAVYGEPPSGLVVLDVVRRWLEDPDDSLSCRELIQSLVDRGALGDIGPRVRKPEKVKAREEVLGRISMLWQAVFRGERSLWSALQKAASQGDEFLGEVASMLEQIRAAAEAPSDGVVTFVSVVAKALRPWPSLRHFLDDVAEAAEAEVSRTYSAAPPVQILTREAVKGLQKDYVFVVGLEEGLWPSSTASRQREEQSRLLYVAMTRAKEEVHLFHARKRSAAKSFMQQKGSYQPPKRSSFLDSIPEEYCEDVAHWG